MFKYTKLIHTRFGPLLITALVAILIYIYAVAQGFTLPWHTTHSKKEHISTAASIKPKSHPTTEPTMTPTPLPESPMTYMKTIVAPTVVVATSTTQPSQEKAEVTTQIQIKAPSVSPLPLQVTIPPIPNPLVDIKVKVQLPL